MTAKTVAPAVPSVTRATLNYNYFRDYGAVTGRRYVQSDPIELAGGLDTFRYANARLNDDNVADAIDIRPDVSMNVELCHQRVE